MPQDGIRLVKGEVSILKLGELPIQLEGGTKPGEGAASQLQPPKALLRSAPSTKCVTHTSGLEQALHPGVYGNHLLLPALALVSQQHAHGLTPPCMESG